MVPYDTSLQHILAELERIDLLVQVQVWRARQLNETDAQFQGLVITEQEVDALLAAPIGLPRWAMETAPISLPDVRAALDQLAADIRMRKAASARLGVSLRLDTLAQRFDLAPFDVDALLICLAPELDLRYERLYAHLQDDVTQRRPSVDLMLNLLCSSFEAKLEHRRRFSPSAPLLKHHLIQLFDDPSRQPSPLLGKFIKLDERIANYLLDADEIDTRLVPYARTVVPLGRVDDLVLLDDMKRRLVLLLRAPGTDKERRIFYFQGPYGVGKQTAAEALCCEQQVGLLVVAGGILQDTDLSTFELVVQLAKREAMLQGAALYWDGFDGLLAEDMSNRREILLREIETLPGSKFLAGDVAWEPMDALHDSRFVRIEFARPAHFERVQLWQRFLNGNMAHGSHGDLTALATKFRFSGGQIRDAAATARNLAHWRDPKNGQVTLDDLYAACRLQSSRKLATLARKITPHYKWDDIVLPADRLRQLREVCNTIRYRALVYDEWGFDSKLALGKGLNVLFAGPSGTGKTMTAEIIAGELRLDLYKIDLATVVSKYIGETEKNLARIFAEAETSNAILFFDEADALFGKRSEVRDSHDRYANIEIAYLLQRMEEYDGVVILATNLGRNIDDAFVRRMHATVEFPFPDEQDRQRIWEHIWPGETPLHPDLDLGFMAHRFEIAGGNIRNIALSAAFFAADDGRCVTMTHLMRAIKREYQKMGKVVVDGEFGEYARLATR